MALLTAGLALLRRSRRAGCPRTPRPHRCPGGRGPDRRSFNDPVGTCSSSSAHQPHPAERPAVDVLPVAARRRRRSRARPARSYVATVGRPRPPTRSPAGEGLGAGLRGLRPSRAPTAARSRLRATSAPAEMTTTSSTTFDAYKPLIVGKARVGQTVRVETDPDDYDETTTLAYQWMIGGKPAKKGTSDHLQAQEEVPRPRPQRAGHRLRARLRDRDRDLAPDQDQALTRAAPLSMSVPPACLEA